MLVPDPKQADALRALCRVEGVEPIFAWTIAFAVLSGRLAAEKEPVVALGTRAVRVDLSASPSFRELLRRSTTDAASDRTVVTAADLELQIGDGGELVTQLELLLGAMIADPDRPVDQCSLLSARARQLVADPTAPIPRPEQESFERTIAAIAAHSSATPAIEWRGKVWTFGDLEARASNVAAALRERGVGQGDRVVVTGPRCPAIVAAFLGVWKMGGVIVPVADDLPVERRRVVAREAGAGLAIVAGDAEWPIPVMQIATATAEVSGALQLRATAPPPSPKDAAYVFFTSGTTGTPKGVLGTHAGLAHFLAWQRETFGVSKSDRAAQLTGLSFDVVLRDMLMPLSAGATLCFPDRDAASLDPELLLEWLRAERITVMHSVPTVLESWLRAWTPNDSVVPSVGLLFMAGEPLSQTLVLQSRGRFPSSRVVNLYGPTETTLAKCFFEVPREPAAGTQPVGRAMRNAQAFVMSEAGILCGVGEPGEIVIRTPFRTLGYLGEQARAGGRFRPNPLRADPEDLVYFTGDRGRLRLDGQLEILGRVDDQVKINGVRVEPGEVSATVRGHPGVASCFVAAHADDAGRKTLCAYVVVADAHVDADQLRRHVSERLPAAMVPSAFVFLERMPLTANGKVDRKALPVPDLTSAAAEHVAPRDAVEETVAEVFRHVLRLDRVGVHDDFFALGGHSLLAMQVVSRLRSALHIELPVRAFFEGATVARLAERLRASPAVSAATPIVRVDRSKPLLASSAQARLWFLDQLDGRSATYNVPTVLRLEGRVDPAVLERALAALAERHETLRTTFVAIDGEPHQVIHGSFAMRLSRADAASEEDARQAVAREVHAPFDLAEGPLLRATLVRVRDDSHLLVMSIHHIATDGWSTEILLRELSLLYAAFAADKPSPLSAPAIDYADVASWQRAWLTGAAIAQQLAFWKEHLEGAPAALELPTDRPRPAIKRHHGDTVDFVLPTAVAGALRALCRSEGVTSFMVLLAAYQAVLARWSGQRDLVVGTAIANRTRPELEPIVGLFVNTLAMRTRFEGPMSFREVLRSVKHAALSAYAHQDVPFERLVEELKVVRDLSRTPIFQAFFVMQNTAIARVALPELDVHEESAGLQVAKFDVALAIVDTADGLRGALDYDTALFDRPTMDRFVEHFGLFLDAATRAPDEPVATLPLISEQERRRVLVEWNATEHPVGRDRTIHGLVEAQTDRTPDAVAVTFEGHRLTYRELDDRANRVAHWLLTQGVALEDRVALQIERSHDMLSAMLGVLKAGGAYLPIDKTLPEDRKRFMAEDAGVRVVLDDATLARALAHGDASRPVARSGPEHLAYVLYTSGSTGRPKGVMVEHASVANLLASLAYEPGTGPDETTLSVTTLSFDVAVAELFLPLTCGAEVVVASREAARDPSLIASIIEATGARTFGATPTTWRMMVDAGWRPTPGMEIHCAGEALPRDLADALVERGATLWNLYGPTEATVYASGVEVRAGRITIGRPLRNTQLYIVDEHLNPVPIGVLGELCIGGDGVARGYLQRPALTAEKFIPDPFARRPGARLYRTGDLARWLPTGEVDYLGRLDHQVKIRGFRIELGEIESALAAIREVRESVVVARGDTPGDQRLVAYVVASTGAELAVATLRAELARALPDYMVPSAFVVLDALPMTTTGKVDRKALPAPDFTSAAADYVAPRDAVEQTLADVFRQVLGLERVGVHDDFFALGGHSLLAMRVVSRIRTALRIELPVRAVFEGASVARLAERIRAAAGSEAALTPIVRVDRKGPLVASSAQRRLWFLEQLDPGTPTYHVPLVLRIRGPLDVDCLTRSLTEIVRRHEVLRTTLSTVDGHLHQVIHPPADVRLDVQVATGDDDARRRLREAVVTPFDLATGPPLRAALIGLGHHDHRLAVVMHHVVTDGWSIEIFERELAVLYTAFHRRRPSPLTELEIQYADYAAWQAASLQRDTLASQRAYWKQKLHGAPAFLDLVTDRPRPQLQRHRGAVIAFALPDGTREAVAELARREGATPFLVLLAVFKVFLARHTGQTDIVVGTPIANRPHAAFEGLIGFFVNTLVLRTSLGGAPSFREAVARVRDTALDAYEHQDVSFERIVEELAPPRDTSRSPLFQVMFTHRPEVGARIALEDLDVTGESDTLEVAKFDLLLATQERDGQLQATLEYDVDLFEHATAQRLAEHFVVLLGAALARPDDRISALAVMTDDERRRVLVEWNDTAREYPRERRIEELFAEQVERQPEAVALAFGSRTMTYRQLQDAAARVAAALRGVGVVRGARVGISSERSSELVIGVLAILMAGAAYVPLDPSYPAARIDLLVRDAGVAVVLDPESRLRLPDRVRVLRTQEVGADHLAEPARDPGAAIEGARGAAYVLFTSGSTGTPKGVVVEHRAVVRLVRDVDWATFGPSEVFLAYAPLAFDASTLELFGPLLNGGTLVIAPPGLLGVEELVETIRSGGVTFLWFTSGLFNQLVDHASLGALASVRQLVTGGDVLSASHLRTAQRALPALQLLNGYGPTENTTFSTCHRIGELPEGESVPIGRPISNTTVYVLGPELEPTPIGVPGELYTGGDGVARGYLHAVPTAEKFVPDPFAREPGARLYRTGDVARWRADGALQFLGRRDAQVKVRGFRVELGEVEAALAIVPGVRSAVVVARDDGAGTKQLVAYVVGAEGVRLALDDVRNAVARTLPLHMVPSAFVPLDALPLTASGKVDRQRLPAPDFTAQAADYVAPRNAIEEMLADVFRQVLRLERVGVHDDFFTLGGHSLLATQVVSRLRAAHGLDLEVRSMFTAPTIALLASVIGARSGTHESGEL